MKTTECPNVHCRSTEAALRLEVELLMQHIKELEAAQTWQLVNTAPSDTTLLLYSPDRGPANCERIDVNVFVSSRSGTMHAWATHWMPLPEPPKGE